MRRGSGSRRWPIAQQITAPEINKQSVAMFTAALAGKPIEAPAANGGAAATETAAQNGSTAPASGGSEPLELQSVPSANAGDGGPMIGASIVSADEDTPATRTVFAPQGSGNAAPGADSGGRASGRCSRRRSRGRGRGSPRRAKPWRSGSCTSRQYRAASGRKTRGGGRSDQRRPGGNAAQVATGTDAGAGAAGKKKPRPKYDSSDESSSKHKKKKGLDKLNPF